MRRTSIAVLCLALGATTACGSASAPYEPTGVDELTIPTPSPDPDDYVGEVTNPWLPLADGAQWTYDDRAFATVLGTATRGGIAMVELGRGGAGAPEARTVDLYAQDRDGNVWWTGRDGELFEEPGLAMPAEPRLGDGFVMADAPGLEVRAEVVGTDASVEVPAGEYDDVVVLEVSTAGAAAVVREYYAAGVGLVLTEPADAAETPTGLVEYTSPAG